MLTYTMSIVAILTDGDISSTRDYYHYSDVPNCTPTIVVYALIATIALL
jgi:hypothetical protein